MKDQTHVLFYLVRPKMLETTSLGAAIAAAIAEGIKCWDVDISGSRDQNAETTVEKFKPALHAKGMRRSGSASDEFRNTNLSC